MADTNNNDILGSTADLNAGSAVEAVQAEEIKRLEAEKQQAEAARPSPQPIPLTAAQMMQEAAQEAQARTDAAEARAAQFAAPVFPASSPIPLPPSVPRRSSFDAAAANARAANASKGFPVAQDTGKITFSAPKDAPDAFDFAAYEQARQTGYWTEPTPQPLSAAVGEASPLKDTPADDPRIAPSPSYARVGMGEDLWGNRGNGSVLGTDNTEFAYANRVPEYQQEIEAQRAASAVADSPAYSFRDRLASYAPGVSDRVMAGYDQARDFYQPRIAAAGASVAEEWNSPFGKMQAGFALEAVGKSAGAYYEATNRGAYLTPEQQGSEQAAMLPSLFGAAGTVVGAATPLGAWGGSLIGSGVGGLAQGIIGANDERHQATRQTSQELETVTGGATSALREFTDQINSSSAANRELQAAIHTMVSTGPGAGAGSIPGTAFMSGALGERFNPALSGFESALGSDPILRALRPGINAAGAHVSAGEYGDSAVALAAMGDWQGRNDALTLQQGALTNPQYAKDASNADRAESWSVVGDLFTNWHALGRDLSGQVKHYHAGGSFLPNTDDPNQFVPGADAARKAAADDSANAYNLYIGASSADEVAKTGIGLASSRLAAGRVSGQSAAQLGETAQGIYSAVSAGIPSLTRQAAGIDGYLEDHPNMDPTARLSLQRTRDTALTSAAGLQLEGATVRRSVFDASLQENESAYGLDMTGRQSGLTRGLLAGRRYDQLAEDEYGLVSSQQARAVQLRRDAYNPLNDPARRDQMLAQADALETGAAVQRNQFLYAGIQQNIGQAQIAVGAASLGETQAQITGGPQDHYEAAGASVRALTTEIDRLASALRQPGLTEDQKQGLERELTDTRRQAAQAQDTRQQAYFGDEAHLLSTQAETASVGLARAIRRGGNAAFDPAILALNRDAEAQAQSRLDFDRKNTPGNVQRLADDALRVRQAQESVQQAEDTKNDYRPTGAFARQMADDRTAFEVALQAPYIRGGAESDPMTRGNAVIKDIRQDMAQNEASRLRGQRDGTWTDDNETAYTQHKNEDALQLASMEREKRFALFNAIPNTIVGGGGVGNSVQSFSIDALTAAYTPNVLQGSRGRPNVPRGGELPGSLPGNPVDAFERHAAGGASGPASLTTAIQTLAHGMNTQQLATIMQQVLQSLLRMEATNRTQMPGQGGPPQSSYGALRSSVSNSVDTNRPSRR